MKKKMNCIIVGLLLVVLALAFFPFGALAAPANQGEDPKTEADRLLNEGIALMQASPPQPQAALEKFEEALPLYRSAGDRIGEAECSFYIGSAKKILSDYTGALEAYEASLAIWQEIGDRGWESLTLNAMGLAYKEEGQYQQALEFYQQALDIRQKIRDR